MLEPELKADLEKCVSTLDPGPLADTEEKRVLYSIVRARARVSTELEMLKRNAKQMIAKLEGQLADIDECYDAAMRGLTEKILAGGKARSLKTPWGTVGFRKKPVNIQVDDEGAVVAAAFAGELPEDVIETKTTVRKARLNDWWKSANAIPPGCSLVPGEDAFYVDHGDDAPPNVTVAKFSCRKKG